MSTKRVPCPTPRKRPYKTRRAARVALREITRRSGGHHGQAHRSSAYMPSGVYECPCGRWHLTSKPGLLDPQRPVITYDPPTDNTLPGDNPGRVGRSSRS